MSANEKKKELVKYVCDAEFLEVIREDFGSSVYIVKYKDRKCIFKLQNFDSHNIVNEYKFNEFAKLHPSRFLILAEFGKRFKCPFEYENVKTLDYRIYYPVLDGSLGDVLYHISSRSQFLHMLYQVIGSIHFMRNAGFEHPDMHMENILFKRIEDGYQWFIIDYEHIRQEEDRESNYTLHEFLVCLTFNLIDLFDCGDNKDRDEININDLLPDNMDKSDMFILEEVAINLRILEKTNFNHTDILKICLKHTTGSYTELLHILWKATPQLSTKKIK